jgi:hypothetical protein
LEVSCTYIVLPHHIRRWARFITFDLPQPLSGNVVIAGTAIGPVEHKGENKCSNIMACHVEALKHVEPWHECGVVFHEDGAHPSIAAGLWVADASKPSDELGAVLVVVEPVLGPKVYPTQQHLPQWYAPSYYGVAAHLTHLRTACPQATKIFHGIRYSRNDMASNLNSHILQELLHGTRTHAAATKYGSSG